MTFSSFGDKFGRYSAITQLMDDLNQGLKDPNAIMLGGGNPAHIPEMVSFFQERLVELATDGTLTNAIIDYDGPQGHDNFRCALATLFQENYGWEITEKNIMLTNGSQSAFFQIFNLFAGKQSNGKQKKILLPLSPEYIGYRDGGLQENTFISYPPKIEFLEKRQFKYHVDFDQLTINDSVAAICASRPTNPTGNVLTDIEIQRLDALAQQHNIPLIIDNAYGAPFPDIIFTPITPFWNNNTILCLSLSKLGLPGTRCGIVIANETTITAMANINGVINLAPGSIGPAIAETLIQRKELLMLSQTIIKPFYQKKVKQTVQWLQTAITHPQFRIHKPEGALFLWLWFDELPITTVELYRRLKARSVLIVPGEYFFIGLTKAWSHTQQCLRMNYVQDDSVIKAGIAILAEEIEKAYTE
jgi:valine--pyruvate aminotransferase